jgi:Lrp/AsnC family leucine-responsive transcriptional regulator
MSRRRRERFMREVRVTRALDDADLRILALLARDGRMSHAAIGAAVGLSGPAIYERVRKLERQGAIRGYRAILDAEALGAAVLAFVEVDVRAGAASDLLVSLEAQDEVLEAHRVFGYDGLLLKVAAASHPALWAWVERLQASPGVAATRTRIVGATAIERGPAVPVPPASRPPSRKRSGSR